MGKSSASEPLLGDAPVYEVDRSHYSPPYSAPADKPKSYQFRALIRKNFALQKRQWCLNCCQLVVPILLVLLVGITQVLFQHYVLDTFTAGKKIYTNPTNMTYGQNPGFLGRDWYNYNMWSVDNPEYADVIGELNIDGTGDGMLGEIRQLRLNSTAFVPYFVPQSNYSEVLTNLNDMKNLYIQQDIANADFPPKCDTCPRAVVNFTTVDIDTPNLNYTLLVDMQLGPYQLNTINTVINMIDTAFMRYIANDTSFQIDTWTQQMPYIQQELSFDVAGFLSIILFPFAVSFLLPLYVNAIVTEKQERLREMMKMMGLKMSSYWIVNYIYDMILYLGVFAVIVITSLCFQMRFFTQTSWSLNFLVFFGWGNAQIALSFLLSTVFSKARAASIVSWLIIITGVILSYVLNYFVFRNDSMPFWVFFLYPPFACYRLIYLIGGGCTLLMCPTWSEVHIGGQFFWGLVLLYVDIPLYFAMAAYLDKVLPQEYGVPLSPLFCLDPIKKMICKPKPVEQYEMKADRVEVLVGSKSQTEGAEDDEAEEDPDVAAERLRVHTGRYPPDAPIVIEDLKKTYPSKSSRQPEKKAVRSLCLVVEKGECFGLLGPNGAGKTTTISILTGLFQPTSGTARIGGYDIRSDMNLIHRIMSVCPQFDTLWGELTCQETLLFYARLKGVPSSEEKQHVRETLDKVGLGQYAHRPAKNLSGGMRRRLSIAVALVGDPKVVFLDEPTTGLDPDTRRHLWNVLLEVKKGRCMILTTHSMEEADTLSNRIGIVSRGRLRCVGSPLHLKSRYGQGYTLTINADPSLENLALTYVQNLLPEAVLEENFAGHCTFQCRDVVISRVFEEMENNKDRVGIRDWGISQTTLEDVFLTIVKEDEHLEEQGR